jgi:hypothetical protein
MGRIELRDCNVYIQDGLAGTAAVNEPTAAPAVGDTDFDIDTIVLNAIDADLVPIGARFTLAGETGQTVHTITARTPASASPTTNIVFTPALGAGTYADGAALTFLPQRIEIKMGDGDAKWTEADQYKYDLDRGRLDSVRKGDDTPLELSLSGVFEHIKSKAGEPITPIEALKGIDAASQWVSTSITSCEPYSVDIVIEHNPPCGPSGQTTYLFPDFRSEKRDFNIKDASVAFSGKCNAVEPIITRAA